MVERRRDGRRLGYDAHARLCLLVLNIPLATTTSQNGPIRDFDFAADKIPAGKPVYLYSFARAINSDARNKGLVYLNGRKVGEPGTWGAWDVTSLLKPGREPAGAADDIFGGRIFLSTEAPALYPYLGAERNKLWILFQQLAARRALRLGQHRTGRHARGRTEQADQDHGAFR